MSILGQPVGCCISFPVCMVESSLAKRSEVSLYSVPIATFSILEGGSISPYKAEQTTIEVTFKHCLLNVNILSKDHNGFDSLCFDLQWTQRVLQPFTYCCHHQPMIIPYYYVYIRPPLFPKSSLICVHLIPPMQGQIPPSFYRRPFLSSCWDVPGCLILLQKRNGFHVYLCMSLFPPPMPHLIPRFSIYTKQSLV